MRPLFLDTHTVAELPLQLTQRRFSGEEHDRSSSTISRIQCLGQDWLHGGMKVLMKQRIVRAVGNP